MATEDCISNLRVLRLCEIRRHSSCTTQESVRTWQPSRALELSMLLAHARIFGLVLKFKGYCRSHQENVLIGRQDADITSLLSAKSDSTYSAIDVPSLKARVLSTECHRGWTALVSRGFCNSFFLRLRQ
jgi:hypothetical protein